jgi:hypothetical protein
MADRSDDRARAHRNRAADLVTKPTHGRHPPTNCTAGIAIRPARLYELHCLKNKSRLLAWLDEAEIRFGGSISATLIGRWKTAGSLRFVTVIQLHYTTTQLVCF